MKTFIGFIGNLLSSFEPFLFLKGALIFFVGPLNLQLAYLLLVVGIDLVFGIQVARKEKAFKWGVLYSKVQKKLFIYGAWISLFHALDMIAGLPNSARWGVIILLAGMELLSAAKNTAKLGHTHLSDALENFYLALMKINPALKDVKKTDTSIGGQPSDKAENKPK